MSLWRAEQLSALSLGTRVEYEYCNAQTTDVVKGTSLHSRYTRVHVGEHGEVLASTTMYRSTAIVFIHMPISGTWRPVTSRAISTPAGDS